MRESERARTALLRERSLRLRLRAESTQTKSRLLHGEAVRVNHQRTSSMICLCSAGSPDRWPRS